MMSEQEIEDRYRGILLEEFLNTKEPPKSILGEFYSETSWDEKLDGISKYEYELLSLMHFEKRKELVEKELKNGNESNKG